MVQKGSPLVLKRAKSKWWWAAAIGGAVWVLAQRTPLPEAQASGRDHLDTIGVTTAVEQRGRDTPRGWGVVVGHVEGTNTEYGPNIHAPEFRKIHFYMDSGGGAKATGHATSVGNALYGFNGVGIGISDVHLMSSNDWLTKGCLNLGTPLPPKNQAPIRIYNHSWIAGPDEKISLNALARVDYLIDHDNVHVVCGVGNGKGAVPYLIGSAYNAIAVGSLSGSSGNYTRIDGVGRCKPDLVGPKGATSFMTPLVAGCVAGLVEQADRMKGEFPTAGRTDTIRSVLMAGAIKPKGWHQEEGKPLDPFMGAGMVHYNRALTILEHPMTKAGETAEAPGWAMFAMRRGSGTQQTFELAEDQEFCLSLNWNRRVVGLWVNVKTNQPDPDEDAQAEGDGVAADPQIVRAWIPRPALIDLALRLEKQTETGWELVEESDSTVDNVEHVYRRSLPAGTYRATVSFPDRPMVTPEGDGLPKLRPFASGVAVLSWWMGPALDDQGRLLRSRSEPPVADTAE